MEHIKLVVDYIFCFRLPMLVKTWTARLQTDWMKLSWSFLIGIIITTILNVLPARMTQLQSQVQPNYIAINKMLWTNNDSENLNRNNADRLNEAQ
jgi:hypothetical protein